MRHEDGRQEDGQAGEAARSRGHGNGEDTTTGRMTTPWTQAGDPRVGRSDWAGRSNPARRTNAARRLEAEANAGELDSDGPRDAPRRDWDSGAHMNRANADAAASAQQLGWPRRARGGAGLSRKANEECAEKVDISRAEDVVCCPLPAVEAAAERLMPCMAYGLTTDAPSWPWVGMPSRLSGTPERRKATRRRCVPVRQLYLMRARLARSGLTRPCSPWLGGCLAAGTMDLSAFSEADRLRLMRIMEEKQVRPFLGRTVDRKQRGADAAHARRSKRRCSGRRSDERLAPHVQLARGAVLHGLHQRLHDAEPVQQGGARPCSRGA